ncbi:MAG: Lin1244/Lin1753 domain-containing protein [Sediminibacterium sp.]
MKSSTYYFSHDYNAANDTKILFLRHQLGMEGYGIYWYLIEQLANAGGKLPLELIPVLAMQMHCTDVKVNGVLMNFDLFTIESGEFWSHRLQEHLELRLKLSQSGKSGANNRWKNGGAIGGAIGEGNAKERKGKEIKGNINLIEDIQTFKSELGDEYDNFVMYWTEPNKNGKLRYELEKFFDIKRRVNTWLQNKNKYGNSKDTDATASSRKRMDDLAKWINR